MYNGTCNGCKNAVPVIDQEDQFICRRYPPTPFLLNVSRNETGLITGTEQLSIYPIMKGSGSCGEFAPSPEGIQ